MQYPTTNSKQGWGELTHVSMEDQKDAVGVAPVTDGDWKVRKPGMSINNSVSGSPLLSAVDSSQSSSSNEGSCVKRLNKKHIFGIGLLVIVDLIWVGSAGLTKFLFKTQNYDKPLFTVYFKTVLFTIYLLPFLFWRPWQRLCCNAPCRKRQKMKSADNNDDYSSHAPNGQSNHASNSELNHASNGDLSHASNGDLSHTSNERLSCTPKSGDLKSYGSINDDTNKQNAITSSESTSECVTSSSFNSSYSFCEDNKDKLGPSSYTPLKRNRDSNEFDTNSLTLPRRMTESKEQYLTASSSVPLTRCRQTHVRFCQTVEVKTVPEPKPRPQKVEEEESKSVLRPIPIVPVRIVIVLALIFGILWFFANYLYARALETQSVAAVNTLSSLSGVFVLILAAIPLPRLSEKDRFSLTKLIVISLSVAGAVMIGFSRSSDKDGGISVGALYAIGGSCLYASYLVLLSKFIPHPDSLEIPMFFGFVGLIDGLLLLPVVAFWHYTGIEIFEWPTTYEVWTILLVNGFVGTVLSELLWLWGCLLTSSLVGTISLSLVTPLSITYSIVVSNAQFSIEFFFGAAMIVIAFILIAILDHSDGWDPVWLLVKKTWNYAKDHSSHRGYSELSSESKDMLHQSTPSDSFSASPPPIL